MNKQDNNSASFDSGNVFDEGEILTRQEKKEESRIFKKWWFRASMILVLVLLVAGTIGGCSKKDALPEETTKKPAVTKPELTLSNKTTVEISGISFNVDGSWSIRRPFEDDEYLVFDMELNDKYATVFSALVNTGPRATNTEENLLRVGNSISNSYKSQFDNGEGEIIYSGIEEINGIVGFRIKYTTTSESDTGDIKYYHDSFTTRMNGEEVSFSFMMRPADQKKYEKVMQEIFDSLRTTSGEPNPLVDETATLEPVPDSKPTPSVVTKSQENAVKKAKEYLNFMAFSRQGLIEQLEYEGFSNEDAVYGVDHVSVNWNAQAAKKASDYLDLMSFSRQGLIDQLLFEGFTEEEAIYGVDFTGL